MRFLPHVLAALLLLVQADLWFGRSNLRYVAHLERELQAQRAASDEAAARNAAIEAELGDLVEGLEMVEERARTDLGMLRKDEILVQFAAPR
ncbi:MAG TPA: septum formation initiator family protein [Rubrivivax sp.]|nr:septum formation initiator family protein [Rhodoferax sp.]MCL4738768.1 septum formation initiator family protein [Burkholderiaceae bacterium]MCP5290674.1 septum formation initiator family protein [Burkholderiaceae bacterium]HMQ73558.1 septum formation initiator family protein [Rubrivivax sp.]HMR69615.1 septum formation initiator family protein [Rubrivivax sp.]